MKRCKFYYFIISLVLYPVFAFSDTPVPPEERGNHLYEHVGHHDANNFRTRYWNYGMVGDYPSDPVNVDLSVFHSMEVPKGSGVNYGDGTTPFILAKVIDDDGNTFYIMETGYRERQETSPYRNLTMRFEPRPGFFQQDFSINTGEAPAISNDPRTWPDTWPDKESDIDDPGWPGSWNGYFGKQALADQESFTVMDDDYYDKWNYTPDSRDSTRNGLALRTDVRGFQWSNPQANNVVFWHYDVTNEGTTNFDDNIIFGLYMDSGIGGSGISCDGIAESDDDNAYYDKSLGLNLVYTWDKNGHGISLSSNCFETGYLGYAYLETPGNPFDGLDNDSDGMIDEKRDSGPGQLIEGREAIRAYVEAHYDMDLFEKEIGSLETRPAYKFARWWTGDEDMDWIPELFDAGTDGVWGTGDTGEGDMMPTAGEGNFDRTDLNESDQIGLTGFKMNRIRSVSGQPTDNIVFFDNGSEWPRRLYDFFSSSAPFDDALVTDYNIGFLFASGPFILNTETTERFSLALAYGADNYELRNTVRIVQQIYNANYRYAVPPTQPVVSAEVGDGWVRLNWNDLAEKGIDPVSLEADFEGYRIYRSTDPEFRDPKVISNGRGTGPFGNGRPIAQFDLIDGIRDYSPFTVEGIAYYYGNESGIVHTWTDSTVTNGQLYYYAVCAYDFGSDSLGFYPSENPITVSRSARAGTVLPSNVVEVRPEPKVMGFKPATATDGVKINGGGIGTVRVEVVNSSEVPEDHTFLLKFRVPSADSVRASFYDLIDSTANEEVFTNANDLDGLGIGSVGKGLLPVVWTPKSVSIDSVNSGFASGSVTNVKLKITYQTQLDINRRRDGFPNDLKITFSDVALDTSIAQIGKPARPSKFKIEAITDSIPYQLNFLFYDPNADGVLNSPEEFIDAVTYVPDRGTRPQITWRIALDTTGLGNNPVVAPTVGDVYNMYLNYPLRNDDRFIFTTTAEYIDQQLANEQFDKGDPYVVPNPYIGSASFEPERFAISGRGERRMEFRNLPNECTIRIYTVKGELVRTLRHEGSTQSFVAWNLRTKDNLDVAPGLYIFHVDGGKLGEKIGKFAIIK
ncbi:MAG: hypothetical protein KDF60_14620 [Calditrichaeota bacterium]|nr:hypothetical protein [Calditrichota bacterium]